MFFNQIDSGKTQIVPFIYGTTFDICLKAIPSAGYLWFLKTINSNCVKIIGDINYILDNNKTIGNGGNCVASFKILKPGIVTITLENKRPWNNDISETFSITLDIQ